MLGAMKVAATLLFVLAIPSVWAQGPMVFINGNTGLSGGSSAVAIGGIGVGGSSISKHDKTAEMARVMLKSCPEVSLTVNDSDSHSDYLMVLSRDEGTFGSSTHQIMVLRPDKSVLFASNQSSVPRATKQSCKAIMADWKNRRPHTIDSSYPPSTWNITKPVKEEKH
jgi:hypothetical protein